MKLSRTTALCSIRSILPAAIAAVLFSGQYVHAQQPPIQTPPSHLQNYFGPAPRTEFTIPLEWLDRISRAARELPYTGVFVHQAADGTTATSRITHVVDRQGVEHEKLELMDGPLTEIIRRDQELTCYRPDSKTVRIDRRATGRFFPSLLSGSASSIAENYRVRLGQVERIAGFDCQWVVLEPKDALRYMQKLCAELGTGLLLRAKLFNERNQVIEQFAFTQLDVSRPVPRQELKSRYEKLQGWLKDYAVKSTKDSDTGWSVANLPSGFKKVMEMTRSLVGRPQPVSHLVYSDGVLNVSVFVESVQNAPNSVTSVLAEDGPTSLAMRAVSDYQVTVMGEVPLATVQSIADGVSRRVR
jgi:sigma-E factor negative regulatory protein RseB